MPLPTQNAGYSAVNDLGLGGMLSDQVKAETEEERKKRMLAAGGSPFGMFDKAATMLLGGRGGGLGY